MKKRLHYSFASKFAHFFIDPECFPIYDSYADRTLRYHLGPTGYVSDPNNRYRAFVRNFCALMSRVGSPLTTRELDRYLWIASQYHSWRRNPTGRINTELRRLFERSTPEEAAALDAILGHGR